MTFGYILFALVIGTLSGGVYAGVSLLASAETASTAGLPTLSTPLLVVVGLLAAVIGSVRRRSCSRSPSSTTN